MTNKTRWEPITSGHHLTVSAWQATDRTSLLRHGRSTASLEAIHGLGLMSEAGNVNKHPRWQAQNSGQATQGMENLARRAGVPAEVSGAREAAPALCTEGLFSPGVPVLPLPRALNLQGRRRTMC